MVSQCPHSARIQREGLSYLKTALASNVSGDERASVVSAALLHLNRKSKRSSVSNASQSQSAYLSQNNSTPQSTKTSAFLNTLAEGLDFEIPVGVLIKVAVESAKMKALPVLTKCLSILAKKQSLGTAGRDDAGDMPLSPTKKRKASNGKKRKSKKSKLDPDAVEGDDDSSEEEEEDDDDDGSDGDGATDAVAKGRTGQAFVDNFVTRLVCHDDYRADGSEEIDFVFIASSAREAPLSESTTKAILMCMIHRMESVPVFELPAFVYQMLLLASAKGNLNLKKLFLVSLAQQFQRVESKAKSSQAATQSLVEGDEDAILGSSGPSLDEIHQVQGTTLFHIEYALKQDPALVSELVKLARSSVESQAQFMTPFGIAILMSVARSPSIRNELLGRIHDSLVKFGKERTLREVNIFASRVTGDDDPLVKPSDSLLEAASRTGWNGWEEIAEPMLRFANLLLDKPIPTENSLPGKLLRVLFGAQAKMRKSILENIVSRIALREKSTTDVIVVLSDLARSLPFDIMELSSYLRQCIEECVQLPPILAESLIDALKPLLRSRRDLLDYYFIVMRKALFHHDKNNRAVAGLGFLSILGFRHLENNPNGSSNRRRRSSQGSRSSRNRITEDDKARIRAACQPLRRTLSHPPALKALLYKQIGTFVTQLSEDAEKKEVCIALENLLKPHLRKYISVNNAPHLHLDFCVDESSGGSLVEPLGNLIQCLSTIDLSLPKEEGKESYILNLARKVAAVSLDDFAISKDAVEDIRPMEDEELEPEQLATNAAAKANRVRARVIGNVADSLISASLEYAVDSGDRKIVIDVTFPLMMLREKTMGVLKVLGCTSASDAIRDLSGDASIEAGLQAVPISLRGRQGRSSGGAKKAGKSGKGAGKGNGKQNSGGASGGSSSAPSDYRLGAFNVMFSGFTVPIVPLRIAAKCLEKITKESCDSDPLASYFSSKRKERDVVDLHAYLLAVAGQHLQNSNKSGTPYYVDSDSVCSMARISLRNVGKLKDEVSTDLLRYILLLEACAKTLTTAFGDDENVFEKMMTCLLPDEEDGSDPEYTGMVSNFNVLRQLEDLIDNLLQRKASKEAAELLRAYRYFAKCIERYSNTAGKVEVRRRQMQWARTFLNTFESADEASVRSLTTLALMYTEDNDDMKAAEQVVDRIHVVMGDVEANQESPVPTLGDAKDSLSLAPSIRRPTSFMAAESVLDVLDIGLDDIAWCLIRMNSLEAVTNAASENRGDDSRIVPAEFTRKERDRAKEAARQAYRAEDAALKRGSLAVNNLTQFLHCAVAKWELQERLLQCAIRAFKYSTIATNAQLKRKNNNPRTSFVDLIEEIKMLGPSLWKYVSFMGTEEGKDNSTKGAKKSQKEGRIMPNLIYEVESFEKSLIALQKVTKGVNLLKNFRRNTARDYRIQESKMSELPDDE